MADNDKYAFLHQVIAEEKELDISIDRVDKLEAPLLVIGLGGTGSEAVHVIKSTFAKRYNLPVDANGNAIPVPRNTAYLVIDSDAHSQEGVQEAVLHGGCAEVQRGHA